MAEQKFYATGKRKTSIARVWMKPGTGEIIVNQRTIDEYFGRQTSKMVVRQPLELTENVGKFDICVNVYWWWSFRSGRCDQARHHQGAARGRSRAARIAEEGRFHHP